jgi:hypothetical protein
MAAWEMNSFRLGLHFEAVEMCGGDQEARRRPALYSFHYRHILRGRAERRLESERASASRRELLRDAR